MSPLGLYPTGRTSPRNLLLDWRATDLSLQARNGQPGTLVRAGTGTVIDANGVLSSVANNVPRFGYVYGQFGLLLEPPRANSAPFSSDVSNAVWASSGISLAPTTSIIAGQTAQIATCTNPSLGQRLLQNVGTFVNGQKDTGYWILENVSATTSLVAINDVTAAAYVGVATFTWATKTVALTSGSGTVGSLALGNGRYLVWLTITGTASGTGGAGNTRRIECYPCGATDTTSKVCIVHHGQLELNAGSPSSAIVTTTVAVSRATDLFSLAYNGVPGAMALYVKFLDLGTYATTNARVLQIGSSPRVIVYCAGASNYQALYENGTNVNSTVVPTITYGDTVELRAPLAASGAVQIGASVNAGTESVAALSLASSWPGQTLYINSDSFSANSGCILLQAVRLARGNPTLAALQTLDLN
jgi:hypothetical protein